jgi:hypothetical protein
MAVKIRMAVAVLLMLMSMVGPSPAIPVKGVILTPLPSRYYLPIVGSSAEILAIGPDGGGVTPVVFNSKNPLIAYTGTWGAGVNERRRAVVVEGYP